ncbi:NADP-dependent isocitrate dehydrogenase [Leptospira noguchii]|uniref:Isocitrate dehydrogenase [NADP] n=2 Tax=Leptospira noguchii TaxID=28182 RepID=M6U6L9_9LEPT|nr:NADP-dependent isocitrate dehydrogenase [Leptospira noguchii]EMO40672.1 isocitrate dehydrogenase [Leptospira noguchii serovar Autumnalis str. ZUN142]EMS85615.1 isocitrate dehydrogenase [Leptospira noguchii str. Hook]EMS86706.1 isocitrate dehydrogenase [Leptospira noguchii str. Cascata]TQE63506.1 NADP-dependent isocitrate dehydrogenase [Leptospira noguchii]UOG30387.1 NADP-dependent isocitrate dehydrogenase [Leptospira noguchii]
MSEKTKIAIAHGDGIGPEIMEVTLKILNAAGAKIEPIEIEIGEKVYKEGHSSGIKPEAWDILRQTKVFLKAPITTPQGGGYKSLNVTVRTTLGLFANVRPCFSLYPYVETKHPSLDIVIIRENEEDLYTGIEHRQTNDTVQCLKLISRPGSEKIIRYAFEYARAYGRKKVTAMVKDNIMKQTDGLFHDIFKEVAKEYPDLEANSQIIDIGAANLADRPQNFDVVVTLNLYGDIISDIVAQIAGSVGMAGSSNIGEIVSMFEAIHGSAPDIAGKNLANPSGLLNAAVMMLVHIGQPDIAAKINNAWLLTIEEGIHTGDIFKPGVSRIKVGTKEFSDAVIGNLGHLPEKFKPVSFGKAKKIIIPEYKRIVQKKDLVGVDIFLDWIGNDPNELGNKLKSISDDLMLKIITNRGVKVYPDGQPETFLIDHWRCRFVSKDALIKQEDPSYHPISHKQVAELLLKLNSAGFDTIKTENLYYFNGKRSFSLGQGE